VPVSVLSRYLHRQLFTATAYAVAVLSAVLVIGNVFKHLLDLLVNKDIPIETILLFLAYVLPFSLSLTIPWGFLTGVLLVFSKMSAENELLAMRMSGLSYSRICTPVFLLAGALSLVCLWINTDVSPRAQDRMRNAIFSIAVDNPLALFASDQVIEDFPSRKIYIGRKAGDQLENIHVFEYDENFRISRVVFARRGALETDMAGERVLMHLREARFEQSDSEDPDDASKLRAGITMGETTLAISLQELYEKNRRRQRFSQLTYRELRRKIAGLSGENLTKARTEISKRFSFSLACVAFGLIAVPLGITTQRRETSAGFGVSLAVAFTYFLLIIIADSFRERGELHPELLMWIPNILFIALGAALFIRLSRR